MESSKRAKTNALSWVSGGQLGFSENIQGAGTIMLKRTVIEILQDGESVTRALKRLRPAPKGPAGRRAGGKRARELEENRRAAEKLQREMEGGDADAERAAADARRLFDRLTEAASELMDLGFEDIYQQSRADVEASIGQGLREVRKRSQFVWHDDGRERAGDDACERRRDGGASFRDLAATDAAAAAAPVAPEPSDAGSAGAQATAGAVPGRAYGARDAAASGAAPHADSRAAGHEHAGTSMPAAVGGEHGGGERDSAQQRADGPAWPAGGSSAAAGAPSQPPHGHQAWPPAAPAGQQSMAAASAQASQQAWPPGDAAGPQSTAPPPAQPQASHQAWPPTGPAGQQGAAVTPAAYSPGPPAYPAGYPAGYPAHSHTAPPPQYAAPPPAWHWQHAAPPGAWPGAWQQPAPGYPPHPAHAWPAQAWGGYPPPQQ